MKGDSVDKQFQLVIPSLMRTIRKALGYSQDEMARAIGVTRQMVNYYERGESCPSAETWISWMTIVDKNIRILRKENEALLRQEESDGSEE